MGFCGFFLGGGVPVGLFVCLFICLFVCGRGHKDNKVAEHKETYPGNLEE